VFRSKCAYSEGAIQAERRPVVTAETTTTAIERHDNAYWPDEALLADFVEKDDQVEQVDRLIENNSEYAALYFLS
jgi:hypothetical protein